MCDETWYVTNITPFFGMIAKKRSSRKEAESLRASLERKHNSPPSSRFTYAVTPFPIKRQTL